jgi:quercetin dioxygenase-like cupin family protein
MMKQTFVVTFLLCLGAAGTSAQPPAGEVVYLPAARVSTAFAKGMPLLETAEYKIHASRREAPGQAEIHTRDTDIIYVLEGSVTFVTGGTVANPTTVGPDEIRGSRIDGGTRHTLAAGDVIVVPAGTPHWFSQVDGAFLYYVVKAVGHGASGGGR